MKYLRNILLIAMLVTTVMTAKSQTATVPDSNFINCLKARHPEVINDNNELITAAADTISIINCSGYDINTLESLHYFASLKKLDASNNALETKPDITEISQISTLETVNLSGNRLGELPDLSNNTNIRRLDVAGNMLADIPDISNLEQLRYLNIDNNELTSLQDISSNTRLHTLSLDSNKLSSLPEISNLASLKILNCRDNILTALPDVSSLDSLLTVNIQNNYLSFSDLLPVKDYPGYDSIFHYVPQETFYAGDSYTIHENSPLVLSTNIDTSLQEVTYKWYLNGAFQDSTHRDSFMLETADPADAGNYTCRINHKAFSALTLYTDTFAVNVTPCMDTTAVSYNISRANCLNQGRLEVSYNAAEPENVDFHITNTATGAVTSSASGNFSNLPAATYRLALSAGPDCEKPVATQIVIPGKDCREVYITPNKDSEQDAYYFDQQGKAIIYDKSGKVIRRLSIPGKWKGKTQNGRKVPQGYFVADINNGQDFVMISVIY